MPVKVDSSKLSEIGTKNIFIGNKFFAGTLGAKELSRDCAGAGASAFASFVCVAACSGGARRTGTTIVCFLCSFAALTDHAGGV
ncbi:MAG: hypothetical protein ABI114_10440 [Rhodanobacter sp.]